MSEQPTQGGRRQGTPGKAYANRTDLATNYGGGATAGSGGMGPATPAPPPQAAPQPTPGAAAAAGQPMQTYITPDQTPGLFDPTDRPDEPLMAGTNLGAGANRPQVPPHLSIGVERLRLVYRLQPNEGLREILEFYDRGGPR